MNTISKYLGELEISNPQSAHNLTMIPILSDTTFEADYLLLDEALENDVIEISEVSEDGDVPNLKVLNKGSQRVLMLDGEELLGAKQNRILNVTVLVPAKSTISIPVSCVEAGRWHRQSSTFRSAGRTHYAEGRATKARRVNETLRERGSRHGSQGEVWGNISMKADRMRAHSQTAASDEMYSVHRTSLDEYLSAFSDVPNQIGAIFSVNGFSLGVDLFDSNKALKGSLNKLIESYALDAVDQQFRGESEKSSVDATQFLSQIQQANPETYPGVGEGEDFRFDNGELSGGALVANERVIHLCAFHIPDEEEHLRRSSRMVRASARSRNRFNQ